MFGRAGFVFHLGLAVPAFGSFLFVFDFLGGVCVFFIFQMFSALLCGPICGLRFPRDPVLNKLQVFFRMLLSLAEHPVLPPSIFLPISDGGLGYENTA